DTASVSPSPTRRTDRARRRTAPGERVVPAVDRARREAGLSSWRGVADRPLRTLAPVPGGHRGQVGTGACAGPPPRPETRFFPAKSTWRKRFLGLHCACRRVRPINQPTNTEPHTHGEESEKGSQEGCTEEGRCEAGRAEADQGSPQQVGP